MCLFLRCRTSLPGFVLPEVLHVRFLVAHQHLFHCDRTLRASLSGPTPNFGFAPRGRSEQGVWSALEQIQVAPPHVRSRTKPPRKDVTNVFQRTTGFGPWRKLVTEGVPRTAGRLVAILQPVLQLGIGWSNQQLDQQCRHVRARG